MNIRPIFTTTVAKDVYNVDGSLWLPKGSRVSFTSSFKTRNFGNFSLVTPNPVHLLVANLDYLIIEIGKEAATVNQSNKIIVYSKLVDGVKKYSTEDLLKLDPKATQMRKLDENRLYNILHLSASCLVSLIAAVEAFVNQELPQNYETFEKGKDGKIKKLKKTDIEAGKRLEEKIKLLSNVLNKKNYKQEQFWRKFKEIKRLRDSLVHIKTKGSNLVNRNDKLFKEIFDFDLSEARQTTVSLLNYFIPNYID
jgi:hypothetical protein